MAKLSTKMRRRPAADIAVVEDFGPGSEPGEMARRFFGLTAEERLAAKGRMGLDGALALQEDIAFLVREDLETWCRLALAGEKEAPAAWHRYLIRELGEIASGENDRLMVTAPPGHAKSKYATQLFPAWFLSRLPYQSVIVASNTSDLAEDFSRKTQGRIRDQGSVLGIGLKTEAVKSWKTTNDGEYFAGGVGTAITGRRADLAIIDDPFKDEADANSAERRDQIESWYKSVLLTRLKPTGRIVIINTRWHQDDLSGRLLASEPDKWRVIRLPAIAEEGDPLGRAAGDPLWPEYWPLARLLKRREELGGPDSRPWNALYQQRPTPEGGALFNVRALAEVASSEGVVRRVRAWDLAATENAGDWTVGLLLGRTGSGRFLVEDVVRFRGGSHEVEGRLLATARADGRGVAVGLAQDPGSAGKSYAAYLTGVLAGFQVVVSVESGSKETRAAGMVSQCNAGNLAVVSAAWNRAFREELAAFPAGKHDDQVDALVRAFLTVLGSGSKPARQLSIAHMAR